MSDPEKLAEKARLERQDDELSGKVPPRVVSKQSVTTNNVNAQSPVERGVYEGLQLDMREKRGFDDHSAWTSSDKLKKELEGLQASPVATHGNHYYRSPGRPAMVEEVVTDPRANERRICGMRRRAFWILFSVILAIVIIAAVIGGAVGGTRKHSSPPPPPPPPATSPPPPLPPYDIMAASPIKALAFEGNNSQNVGVQSFRLHYQSVNGNIKELKYDGILAGWHNATPIFTDARNHTGLATYMYLNGTALMGAMFYQDVQGILQEKRKKLATSDNWLPGSLGTLGLLTNGSFNPQPNSLPDTNPSNDWDGLNIAAVYSMNFPTGPGGRLYYHFTSPNGSAWIQELKWDQAADVWETGTTFVGGAPNSHIAATIDEQHKAVRVFYSTGNGTLQESWSNITQYNGTYNLGIKVPNLLPKTDADMAALTMNGSTLLYYYSNNGTSGIQELNITGLGSSGAVHSNPKNIVAEPALLSDGGALSQYTPLTAALAFLPGTTPAIHVFYADNTVSTTSGYSRLSDVSRPVDNGTWPASTYGRSEGQIQLPLGTESVDAHA